MIIVDVMMSYPEMVSHGSLYLCTVVVGRGSTHLQPYSKRLTLLLCWINVF